MVRSTYTGSSGRSSSPSTPFTFGFSNTCCTENKIFEESVCDPKWGIIIIIVHCNVNGQTLVTMCTVILQSFCPHEQEEKSNASARMFLFNTYPKV